MHAGDFGRRDAGDLGDDGIRDRGLTVLSLLALSCVGSGISFLSIRFGARR
jgi:hypothetical protein